MTALELWGGLEYTVNRTQNGYVDQTRLSGHHDRDDDLDLFAELGLRALRYPLIWERIAPDGLESADWRWTDRRLTGLRDRGVRPIAGLVHHGSGPSHTSLIDDGFAAALAQFAGRVAERYDWIGDWTPINEPLTTARFSGLYGLWYPHHRTERSFWHMLVNQVDAVRLSMKAIRRVIPTARLIQTDDVGRTYSTLHLAEQAAFDNLRRWAGWDLLFGRVTRHHPLWLRLSRHGLGGRLAQIADDPSPPDIIGVNHYLTSDRFLDHRLQRYDARTYGGNGQLHYADTEAIRVLTPAPAGLTNALRETWDRYKVPLAITEVHNGCTRDEQLRWAADAWDEAVALKADGIDIRAVTAWSLLGSHGWNTLLTRPGKYESGVYEVVGDRPRPTALAALWKGLPHDSPRHPVLAGAGWWRRPERIIYPPIMRPAGLATGGGADAAQPLLICGATGTLGQAFARACAARDIACVSTGRGTLDLDRPETIAATLDTVRPWAVVNTAGWVDVDAAEHNVDACFRANAVGAVALSEACAARGIGIVNFSSDLVFDGTAERPYAEDDAVGPLNVYGRSKAAMEQVCATLSGSLVLRTAAFFSPDDPHNFAAAVVRMLSSGQPFGAAEDHVVTPTFVSHLVSGALDLLIDGATGIWHLTNAEALSWAAFARRIAEACALDTRLVKPVTGQLPQWIAPRPLSVPLVSRRGVPLPPLSEAIEAFADGLVRAQSIRRCA
ncbi:family 1 glycosylhydrolase [uncultured Sphingomonas sp.]|uniref:family 1 glycosylhydrolase n=1 Tax=uncultured Sphingomonas sp. TaxID=158754 RepID=UPI0035C9D1EE